MRALALTGVRRFEQVDVPASGVPEGFVLVRVAAVGLCGTDWHIYSGDANYHLDSNCSPIPLSESPQILGHEIAGIIESTGDGVDHLRPGDLVLLDQVVGCLGQKRTPWCEYCQTGDCHQCQFGQEYGVTGPSGGFAELLSAPAVNVLKVPPALSALEAALVEPLGCIVHAQDRSDRAQARFGWTGERRIHSVAILGAGPSGLLFLQYLRNVRNFDGEIFVVDQREAKLELVRKLGGTAIHAKDRDVTETVRNKTRGRGVEYLIEATGNGTALALIPALVRRQATLLLYGAGHANLASGCLTPWQSMELDIVCSAGASGKVTAGSGPETYARALKLVAARRIDVACLVTHQYSSFEQLPNAFSTDWHREDFVKAVFLPDHKSTPTTV